METYSIFAAFSLFLLLLAIPNPSFVSSYSSDRSDPFSILTYESLWHDYSPPSPPPPPPPPDRPAATCADDLGGVGDFDTRCEVVSSVSLPGDVYIAGNGSLVLLGGIRVTCQTAGCEIVAKLSGEVTIGNGTLVGAGRVVLYADNITLNEGVVIDTTGLAGDPPDRTSGVPTGTHGDGGGHGGRGASCYVKEGQTQEDSWGGDAYSWSSLEEPDSYGSKGGSTSVEKDYGGGGGGRIWLFAEELLEIEGSVLANGGDGYDMGGGGSGGSIFIKAAKM